MSRVTASVKQVVRGWFPEVVRPVRIPHHDVDFIERLEGFHGWLSSYPRSGNGWMRTLVGRAILAQHGRSDLAGLGKEVVPDVYESPGAERQSSFDGLPVIVKSHAISLPTRAPTVFLARWPADSLVSFWRFATEQNYKERSPDPDAFALANLPRWLRTAEVQLNRARSTRIVRITLYPDLCDAPEREVRAALATWGVGVSPEAVDFAVGGAPPVHLEHGYAASVLSRRVLRRIERTARPLWDGLRRVSHERGR